MEAILTSLIASGPWGILCAIQLLAVTALFAAWRATERELKVEIRRGSDALHTSTDAIRASNEGRTVMARAADETHRLIKEVIGRQERQNALLNDIDVRTQIQDKIESRRSGK